MQKAHIGKGRAPLEEIQVFVEVAAAGSFSAAAERLNLSHSSLSRKVAHLEDWLGLRLLERRPHGVQLTQEGMAHFLQFRDGLGLVYGALAGKARRTEGEIVRISLFHIFATTWLFPRHQMLVARAGGIEPRYIFDRRLSDFTDGTDLAIRFGAGQWPRTRVLRLLEESIGPVAGAASAARLGTDAEPAELLRHPLIHLVSESAWRAWFASRGIVYRLRPQDYVFEDQLVVLSAVENSVGIGLSRVGTAGPVAEGRLFAVSTHAIPGDAGYFLVRPEARPLTAAALGYARALLREAGASEGEIAAFVSD